MTVDNDFRAVTLTLPTAPPLLATILLLATSCGDMLWSNFDPQEYMYMSSLCPIPKKAPSTSHATANDSQLGSRT